MGRQRPAVVPAGLGYVDLVAAARAVLVGPEPAGPGIQRGALLVAVAIAPDLRPRVGTADEGIVLGNAAVRIQADDLALQLVQVLRGAALVVLAEGDEQVALAVEDQARAEVMAAGKLRQLPEDHVEALQPSLVRR